jgi:hypothetical protein
MRKLWGAFIFVLVLGSLGACGYLYSLLRHERIAREALEQQIGGFGPRFDQFKDAVRDVDRKLAATVFQEVDLTASGWQPIAGGLYVSDVSAVPAGKGLPDVPASTHKVFFALDGSTISFATSSTRKRGAGEPVDTDRALR